MLYRVQMMNNEDYHKMMCGDLSFNVRTILTVADSEQEAVKLVQDLHPDCHVNDKYAQKVGGAC